MHHLPARRIGATWLGLGLFASTLTAAAPTPAPAPAAIVQRDLAYGPDPAQRLDVYRPRQARKAPIVLMVHGGGWRIGDKAGRGVARNKAAHWNAQGRIVVSINYRLPPQADPLQQAADVARALAYVQREAPRWGGDGDRVALVGHSAGAHLVALLAAAPELARAQDARPWRGTVALDSAAYDVEALMRRPHLRLYDQAFGADPRGWREASPMQRLRSAPAPMLLVCSSQRRQSCPQARAFARRAGEWGGRAQVLPLDLDHAAINAELGADGGYTARVDAFLASL
ncbi:alpha/beta hydrolase fold domain-containing protein [Lysobacter silvisoli]|uniref:Alpha/beta hydrolase n=1 Tax=Lysobacter silvisoli TaxID=2293254 RepID=A0A371K2Q8_9GAMM|nr:alpha/beta hydrolase [Lysobacter silvisoli]RDZ28178.1 alpha/beta hydrolase [Lysobacter silvisoli]